jgi:hypothetical protein
MMQTAIRGPAANRPKAEGHDTIRPSHPASRSDKLVPTPKVAV